MNSIIPHDIDSAIEKFLRLVPADGLASPKTLAAYRDGIGQWVKWCRYHGIAPMTASNTDVLSYRAEISQDYSRATVKLRLTCVRMVYTAFQRWGMRQDNPAAGVKAPKARESEATNVMQRSISFDQARKLLDYTRAVSERDGALIRLLIFHGLRVGEISRMKRSDLNGNILTIHGKGNKLRLIVLSDSCAKELNLIPDGPMFDNGFGGCLTVRSIERIVNKYFTLCGFKEHGKSVHALRHTSATLAIIGGAKREALAQSLGHASPSTTDHYIRAAASYQDNPVYAVEKALGGVQ